MRRLKRPILTSILCLTPVVLFFLSFVIGKYPISLDSVVKILFSGFTTIEHTWTPMAEKVIFEVRFPRILAALIIGAGLSVAGAAFQGIFRNPLVSPYILGVAAGAGFGAALAILLAEHTILIQVLALLFGLLAVVSAYAISSVYKSANTLALILAGVVVGSFFSSLISLIKYVADPYEKLPAIVFWLMGSLANVSKATLAVAGPVIIISIFLVTLLAWRINILSMGDEEALAFGVNIKRERGLIIFLCTVITAAAVCLAGTIGWVGLVIPHIGRLLVGPDHRKLIPACISIGACYLLMIDNLSRTLIETEIPLGILTALIGAPFFAYLIIKNKVGW
ncbi:FecCD family ABC transporter permease [Sporomusa termitida]|uniref:Putative ABC transporter permease protein n=1 Tax=Sporomusa termitida TaxID=2377 RepID=A0A517DQ41_9FIRM|nr:iron ABC transporter permease [Sporomusa termitida]QDR79462.1 putative ABC transporter permease protein [Sporomusa termitida]